MSPTASSRRNFLKAAAVSIAARNTRFASGSRERPPNIVFILADDLGWAELGCYGNTFNETPHLDRLAQEGMRFTQAYAAAPVCSPYRAALMTGQWPARVGITDYLRPNDPKHLPTELTVLPEMLKQAGYVTGIVGKWHLTGYANHGAEEVPPSAHGFDEVLVSENRGIGGGSYWFPYHFNRQLKQRLPGKEYLVDRCNLEAVEFIERRRDQPFFLYLSHYAVHTGLAGKPKLVAKYEAKPGAGKGPRAPRNNPALAAQLEVLDQGVGEIAAQLEALGLADNTVLVFTSDNGGEDRVTQNGPLRAGKSTLYEGGIRVPLLVRYPPLVPAGSTCDTPTSNVDFFPTFCELAGVDVPTGQVVDGVSLTPVLRDPAASLPRDTLYWHYPLTKPHFLGGRSGGAIRVGDWKLLEDFTTNTAELYHLAADLGETKDLAAAEPERARDLRARLAAWRASVGAVVTRHEGAPAGPTVPLILGNQRLALENHGVKVSGASWTFSGQGAYLDLPRNSAPTVAEKVLSIAVTVKPAEPTGVLLAHGGDRTGYALYLVDGRPALTLCVDWKRTTVTAPTALPPAGAALTARIEAGGRLSLAVNGSVVARGQAPGLLSSNPGDSLQIGADLIKPVGDYTVPNTFAGTMSDLVLEITDD